MITSLTYERSAQEYLPAVSKPADIIEDPYVDLVFYNYLLKCFFLIDLKVGALTHQDLGQMDFDVNYFEQEVKQADDGPTIGLILCSDKSEAIVKYTSR